MSRSSPIGDAPPAGEASAEHGNRLVAVTGSLRLGGTSLFLVNLAEGLRMLGHRLPVVVLSTANEFRPELGDAEAPCVEIPREVGIYEDRLRRAARSVAGFAPRAILATLSPESFEVLRQAPRGVLRAGVLQSDDPVVYDLVRVYRPWLDVVVGVSETICNRVRAMPESAGLRVAYIPYGIRFHARSGDPGAGPLESAVSAGAGQFSDWGTRPAGSIDQKLAPFKDGPLRVAYVGRLEEAQKRIGRVVEVIRRCAGPAFTFTIIGSGSQEHAVRAAVAGLPGVSLAGAVSNVRVQAMLADQDVLLLLSDFEGMPLALLEAMGMGVVPVVSDLESGIGDLVTDTRGIRVPVGDPEAAVAALRRLGADRALLARMSAAGAAEVRGRFTAQTMAQRYLDLAGEEDAGRPPPDWDLTGPVPSPLWLRPAWLYAEPARTVRRVLRSLRLTRSRPDR